MTKIKNLLPSLLLIAVYFLTEEFFGLKAGVICAFILGLGEFTYTKIKEHTNDWMIVFITLLFCIPGIISIYTENTSFNTFQPFILESGICIMLGTFAFSKADITSTLPSSYRKTINISEEQKQQMKNLIKALFIVILIHNISLLTAIIIGNETYISFISSTLLYILIALFFVSIFIRAQLAKRKYYKEEWLPVMDEKGNITGKAPRSLCHSGTKLLHPVVHLHIINSSREIFLQKRSRKKELLPGKWDTAVGGHISINENLENALKRETFEELGITDFEAKFIGNYIWEGEQEREFVFSFICTKYNKINIDNEEVDEGRFWSKKEIEKGIKANEITPNFAYEYQNVLKKLLE